MFSEFHRIRNIQSWIFLTIEPILLVLMAMSAVTFLQDRHLASNCYLAAICLWESWYLLWFLVNYSCRQRPLCYSARTYVAVNIWAVSYTAMAARRSVYLLNALISVQRFLAIAFPLKVRSYRWLQQPRTSLALLSLFCISTHIYRPLQYTPVILKDGKGNGWTQGFSSLYQEHRNAFVVIADVCRYLTVYAPMLVCLVANCLMIVALRRHNKGISIINQTNTQKEQGANKGKSERQMTLTILTSTFLMLFFNTPANINEAVSTFSDNYGMLKQERYLYLVLRSGFSQVSQMCDFFIVLSYFLLSTAFRRRFFALFRPVRRIACRRSPAAAASLGTSGTAAAAALHSITQSTTFTQASGTKE
ncbi:hypothetical protein ACOMHN_019806 [Nucella lapillus]